MKPITADIVQQGNFKKTYHVASIISNIQNFPSTKQGFVEVEQALITDFLAKY